MIKTIVFSDHREGQNSIIPYGMKLVKEMEGKMKILDIIDPRDNQGNYTPYSDSQSVTPEVLSHEEVLKKNKQTSREELREYLNREASRINYPLDFDQEVAIGNIQEKLVNKLQNGHPTFLMVNASLEFERSWSYQDILSIISKSTSAVWIVPPGYKYVQPRQALLISRFKKEHIPKIKEIHKLLSSLDVQYNIVNTNEDESFESEIKKIGISPQIRNLTKYPEVNLHQLKKNTRAESWKKLIESYKINLVITFDKNKPLIQRLFTKDKTLNLINELEIPFMVVPENFQQKNEEQEGEK